MNFEEKKKRIRYDKYLNSLYSNDEITLLTEHCWAGNDKAEWQKKRAKSLLGQNDYAGILKRFDQTAYNVGFNDWERENNLS